MLAASIIEPMEESVWVSPMVVQEKKQKDEIRICVDLRKLNDACVHEPFPTPFTDELLDNVGGQEAYSFTDGFFGYHQIKIAPEDKSKTTFMTEWGCFQYTVMPFGLKNAPGIFSRVFVAAFREYIHKFLKVYFDDWIVFGLMTCKKLTGQTPFRLVYGVEVVMPMEYIMPSLHIAALTCMTDCRALEERLAQLEELEEE
eukprot:PITA_22841